MTLRCPLANYDFCKKDCIFRKPEADEAEAKSSLPDGKDICKLVLLVDEITNYHNKPSDSSKS